MRTDHPTDLEPTGTSGPVRTCIGCRRRDQRSHLVRLTASPDDPLLAVVDEHGGAPGRGAWLHHDDACLDLAERRHALRRALRASGEVSVAAVREWMNTHEGTPAAARGRRRGHPPHR